MHFVSWEARGLINNEPGDSAIGFSEIILMAARDISVFDGRIHVCVEMTERLELKK